MNKTCPACNGEGTVAHYRTRAGWKSLFQSRTVRIRCKVCGGSGVVLLTQEEVEREEQRERTALEDIIWLSLMDKFISSSSDFLTALVESNSSTLIERLPRFLASEAPPRDIKLDPFKYSSLRSGVAGEIGNGKYARHFARIAKDLIPLLGNREIEWLIRWRLAESLAKMSNQNLQKDFTRLLEGEAIDDREKLILARSLAEKGNPSEIKPVLSRFISSFLSATKNSETKDPWIQEFAAFLDFHGTLKLFGSARVADAFLELLQAPYFKSHHADQSFERILRGLSSIEWNDRRIWRKLIPILAEFTIWCGRDTKLVSVNHLLLKADANWQRAPEMEVLIPSLIETVTNDIRRRVRAAELLVSMGKEAEALYGLLRALQPKIRTEIEMCEMKEWKDGARKILEDGVLRLPVEVLQATAQLKDLRAESEDYRDQDAHRWETIFYPAVDFSDLRAMAHHELQRRGIH